MKTLPVLFTSFIIFIGVSQAQAQVRIGTNNRICLPPPSDPALLMNYCSNCCDTCCSRSCQTRSLPSQCLASTPSSTCTIPNTTNFGDPMILTQTQCDQDVRCTHTRAPLSFDPSTLAYCVCSQLNSRYDTATQQCIPNTIQPTVLGCIPGSLAEYNTYSDTQNNCSVPSADSCVDQQPMNFIVESASMGGASYGGYYTPRGEKCPGLTAATELCPFFMSTYVIPHCETCGTLNPANPNKCKRVTELEFGYSLEHQFTLPGIAPVPKIETLKDSDPIPPASSGISISRPRTRKISIPDLLK